MTKIVVVGIGGVGGFLGGSLARFYPQGNDVVEVDFIARGDTLKNISERGLIIETKTDSFTVHPDKITNDTTEVGIADYVLYCTKSYDVEQGINNIRSCIGKDTVILPFMNGVDGAEQIKRMLPNNEVWDGCVYIVARIASPGHILEDTGGYFYLFGSEQGTPSKLDELNRIFSDAGIRAWKVDDIERQVWVKFGFIAPTSIIMSYTDLTYGEILADPVEKARLLSLLEEFVAVARAKKVDIPDDLIENVMNRVTKLPPDATMSMQRDFRSRHTTELEALTGYIVREGERLNVSVPTYRMMYNDLLTRL